MKKYLFILSAAVFFFCACEDWKITGDDQTEPEWGKASLCIDNPIAEGDSLCYHIEFNLDTLSGDGELATQLAAILRDSVLYLHGYATIEETEGSPVENGNDSILSYQTSLDCYLGGAHGSYVVGYYNFDKNTGKLLNIKDIVPADKEMLVLMAMEEQLCKDWEAKDLADLQEKTGITMLGDLYLTNNFLLKNDSILFLFNQYEIAPYAAGLISVTVKRP